MSFPSNEISPLVIFPFSSSARRSDLATVDFPQPLSPTIPSVCPLSIDMSMPFTALRVPDGVSYSTDKSVVFSRLIVTCHAATYIKAPLQWPSLLT